jgi:hypothetical protein
MKTTEAISHTGTCAVSADGFQSSVTTSIYNDWLQFKKKMKTEAIPELVP